MPEKKLTVKTLRVIECNDRWECPGRHQIPGVPGSFVVLRTLDHPQVRDALGDLDPADVGRELARFVGDGEILGWTPDGLFDPYPTVASAPGQGA